MNIGILGTGNIFPEARQTRRSALGKAPRPEPVAYAHVRFRAKPSCRFQDCALLMKAKHRG